MQTMTETKTLTFTSLSASPIATLLLGTLDVRTLASIRMAASRPLRVDFERGIR